MGDISWIVVGHVIFGTTVSIAIGALAWFARRAVLRRGENLDVGIAVRNLDVPLAVWDGNDNLVFCNAAYRSLYPELREDLRRGANYTDLNRLFYRRVDPSVIGQRTEADWLSSAQRRREGDPHKEFVRFRRGKWMLLSEFRSQRGFVLSVRTDVTEERLLEAAAEDRRRLVDDLVELGEDYFWRWDGSGRFTEFFAGSAAIAMIDSAAVIGRRLDELAGFDADPAGWAALNGAWRKGEMLPWLRLRLTGADGQWRWLLLRGKPAPAGVAHTAEYHGIARDITDVVHGFERARAQEERMRDLALAHAAWYWETDSMLRVTHLRAGEQNAPPDAVGRPLWQLGGAVAPPKGWVAVNEHIGSRESFRGLRVAVHDQAYVAELAGDPVITQEGRFVGYRGFAWHSPATLECGHTDVPEKAASGG